MTDQKNFNGRIEVGKSYYDRTGAMFEIFRALVPGDPGYSDGYRFRGLSKPLDPDAVTATTITRSFKPDGKQHPDGVTMVSTPSDLVEEVSGTNSCMFGEDLMYVRKLISIQVFNAMAQSAVMSTEEQSRAADTVADRIIQQINYHRNTKV